MAPPRSPDGFGTFGARRQARRARVNRASSVARPPARNLRGGVPGDPRTLFAAMRTQISENTGKTAPAADG